MAVVHLKTMYILNRQKEDIGPVSCEGFDFIIPPGVSAIWEKAGEEIIKSCFNPAREDGVPPLLKATEGDWTGQFVTVTRFKIDHTRIPGRNDLIRLAEERGIDSDTLTKFRNDIEIDNGDIANHINTMPIPDEVRFPEKYEDKPSKEDQPPENET